MLIPRRRITNAYFQLALHKYTPLIESLIKKVGGSHESMEEMRSSGAQAILTALICHDSTKSSFFTYLYARMYGVFRHIRTQEAKAQRLPVVDASCALDMVDKSLPIGTSIMAQELMSCLSHDEQDIIKELFFNSRTSQEVSEIRRISRSKVDYVKRRAISKMKERHARECYV